MDDYSPLTLPMIKGAFISTCGVYRRRLCRVWNIYLPHLPVIMLNPSTADEKRDDPTIRRLIGFAKREGYGGIWVDSLNDFRATDPKNMMAAGKEACSEANRNLLASILEGRYKEILCGWGALGNWNGMADTFSDWARRTETPLRCLGMTARGMPKHPLCVKGDQPFIPYTGGVTGSPR